MTILDNYPTKHKLVIMGYGVSWITSCRDYLGKNVSYVIDRIHENRDVRNLLKKHSRYRSAQKKLNSYDWRGFMMELNSAVGTLEDEKKEEKLEALIAQLSQYPKALGDYREKLKKKGIDTTMFSQMGSAEGTMSVFAKRLKYGRTWSNLGLDKFVDVFVALKDGHEIKTLQGILERTPGLEQADKPENPPKHFVEK